MKKKVVSCLLAAAMVVSSGAAVPGFFFTPEKVQAEENDTKAEKENLALKGTAAASEAEADSTSAAKAIDGNKGTHWGTSQNKVTNEWIEVTLEKPTKVSEIKVFWERTGAAGNHQNNIKQWKVDVKTMSGEYKNIYQKTDEDTYAPSEQTITVAEDAQEVVTAVKITVNKADRGPDDFWSNIGLSEIEIYGEESDIEAAENKNHVNAAGVTAEASTTEASSLPVSNIKDGNNQTRWASDYSEASKQTVTVTFPKVTLVKELDFDLHTRDVAPMPSNVKSFDLVYADAAGTEHTVKISNAKSTESGKTGYVTNVQHIFETPVYMKSFKMTNFDLQIDIEGQNGYNNISILEVRAYSNDQSETPQGQTLDEVVASIKGTKIAKDVNEFTLPNVPDGFTIESNGADFEQIIGEADKETGKLPVVHPMTDKEVQISFNVTETKTGNVKNTGDLAFTVEGTKDTTKAKNAKPSVIPEIQEWFSESDQKVSVDTLTEVTYSDDSLKAIVDEFVSDYKDFTGKELKAGKSSEGKANAFNFKKAAPDELLGDEGYTMDIKSDRIDVQSVSVTGNMYGMQTILQMYKGSEDGGYSIGTMRDYPRYETRGFLLDVARKPVSLEMMKEITRTMRYYKMNDFQAHLSDNYIWLGEYGKNGTENNAFSAYEAFRLESGLTNEAGESPTAKDYSITKEQFKKFIADERAVGMNIVPEIDVPAHALSFTKIWPELKVSNKLHNNNPLIDHFDLTNDAAVTKIKEIFDDYTKGTNPTFDADTVVHIGADEFMADAKSYREFVNEIIPYVDKTNTVRMWGGLTQIKDNPPTEINKDAIDGVQINLWSKDWADGRSVGTAVGKFVHNGQVKKEGIKNATFALPIERIGSKTNALAGKIDNVVVSAVNTEDKYNKKDWTITTDSEYSNNSATEGEVTKAFDGKADTKWHSEWQAGAGETNGRLHDGAPTGQGTVDTIFAQAKFDKGYEIDRIAFTPRQDQPSGYVTKADLYIQTEKDGEMKKVVTDAQFAADKTQKVFRFNKQTVYGFKFVAKASNDGWVAVSEFNVGDEIQVVESGKNTIFVNAEKGGKAEIVGAEAGKPFEVDKGAKVTVKATPDKDYHFVGWYHSSNAETPVSTDAEYEFTVSGNYALTAKFEKDNVTPPVETKDVTSIDKPEKVTVEEGTTFEDLKKDLPKTVTVHFGEGEKAETADVEVTWEKGEYKGEAEKTYTLSGTLGKLPENVTNTKNLKAEIEVEVTKKEVTPPVETKDVISVEKPEKVTVEEGTTFEDLKKDLPKIVTVHFGEGEKAETADVEVTWEKGEYKGEAEKTYTLSGTLGKLPENVTNTKNLKAEIKVEVTKKEVTPPVEKEEYTITVSVNDSKMGTVKLNPEKDSYKEGDVVTATAAAKEGYKFVNWTVDGKAVSDKAEFTFKVDRTLTLKANFEKAAENPNQEDPKDDDKAVQTGDTAGSPIVPIAGLALAAGAVMAAVRKKED